MIKRYKDEGKGVMAVSMILWGFFAIQFIAFGGWGKDWIWGWIAAVFALLVGYLFGSIPRLLRLQDNDGTLEALSPWKQLRMPIKEIVSVRRRRGVGPYGEIWIEGKDEHGNNTNAMRLGMMNFGYRGMKELLLDLKEKNPDIQFDKYAEKIMRKKV